MVTSPVTQNVSREIPFIRGWPLLGSQWDIKHDRLAFLQRLADTADVCGFYFGKDPFVLVNDPELIQKILVEHASVFAHRGRFLRQAFIGNGLIVSEGAFHRKQRKLMASLFQPRQLAVYTEIITQSVEELQRRWKHGDSIDLHQQMLHLSIKIFSRVLFDQDIPADDDLEEAMDIALAHSAKMLFSLFPIPITWPTPYNRRLKQARGVLQKRLHRAFQERKAHPKETEARTDLLSLLLQASHEDGERMSDGQILDESRVLFIAGFESIAMALIWSHFLLSTHPEIAEKVRSEVDQVLAGRPPTYEDLSNLPYCLQVFKEGLRLYPPAPMIRREAQEDIVIDGYRFQQGITILMSPYTLHRKQAFYPEPERFDPDRFAPEREKDLARYAYLPFGGGPRICLGNHFAMMEGHLLIAALAQRVRFEAVTEQRAIAFDLEKNLALRPKGSISVRVWKREQEERHVTQGENSPYHRIGG